VKLGELGGRGSADAAEWSDLGVVLRPDGGGARDLLQCCNPAVIEMLIVVFAVETLDKCVVHGSPRLSQYVSIAMPLRPRHEHPAGELRAVFGAHNLGIAPEDGCPIQQPGHLFAWDAVVHRNIHLLAGEVIGHRQIHQPAPVAMAFR